MYRKPLLTIEDAEALTGQLVRLEYSNYSRPLIGIVTAASGQYIYYRNHANLNKRLRFINGTYVVYATTEIIEHEPPFREVRWRDRPGQDERATPANRITTVNPAGIPYVTQEPIYPTLNLQPPSVQELLQRGDRLHYDFSVGTV